MQYTVKPEDTDLQANGLATLFEVITVIVIVLLCAWASRAGYREYGVLITMVTVGYYTLVAYVKLMFSRLKAGNTYEIESAQVGINLHVDKHTIVWIPVFLIEGKEEKLNLYALTLTVTKKER